MKILLIDDDIDFRSLTKRHLQTAFPESAIREISTRKEFDEAITVWDFDIVITDLENAEIDGLTACQEIRNRDPYLPVIMLTASGNEECAVKGMKLGLSDYITKNHLIRLPLSVIECLEKARTHTVNKNRQHAQFALTHILAESATLDDAAPKILQTICEGFGWELGELWSINQALYALKLNSMWCIPSIDVSEFERFSRMITFTRGVGLPGRVWVSGSPVWIPDVVADSNFPRAAIASKLGLHGAMSFPLIKGTEIVGVMGFFTKNIRQPDKDLFDTMADIGRRIGGFLTRKAAEGLLRTSEHKYRILIENLPQRIFHKDKNSVYVSCNESYAQDLKIKPNEIAGKTDHNFFPRELAEKYRAEDERLMESGQTEEIEEKYIHEGREMIINMVKTPMKDEHGNIAGIIGIFWDITEKKHAEEARNQLTDILETTTDFVATAGVDGRLRYINRTGKKMLGLSEGEDISRISISDCFPTWARTLIGNEGLPKAVSAGVWSGDSALLNRGGYEIPASQVIIAHKNPDGSVKYFSTIARDITDRKRFEEQIVFMANRDPLTNLLNRRRFLEELERLLAQTRRFGVSGALLFLDMDNFKYINDSLGHPAGDKLLMSMACLLRERLRETDILARLGGDEFAIILPHADVSLAESVANQIRELAQQHTPVAGNYHPAITVSIGIALFPGHSATAETLLAYADLAMYRAKEEGRNRICVYTPEQKTQIESRMVWEKRIRESIRQDSFVLFLQPIMDIRQDLIIGHEALLRMINEKGETVAPSGFLDIAERFGLIHDIDRWVVRRAIRLIQRFQQDGKPAYLEVNLSGRSFADKTLLPLIRNELAVTGIDPASLVFEITETSAIENMAVAQLFIAELKSLGCRFALDDFGVGFSSFNYIKHLPVDYLKIDGSFVRNLPYDTVDQHLVKAMVEVARGLGKKTIAEFVENAETVHLLRELGVDYAQGYYIGKPSPLPE